MSPNEGISSFTSKELVQYNLSYVYAKNALKFNLLLYKKCYLNPVSIDKKKYFTLN